MNAAGQMIYGGTGGAATLVAAGTSGQVLESGGTGAPVFTTFTAPTFQMFTSTPGTATGYVFNVSGITTAPTAGATYTNNSVTYTVIATTNTNTLIWASVSGNQTFSGTSLVKTSGTGDSTITFTGTATQTKFAPQKLGTYTTPAGAALLKVTVVGGGGGGGGTSSSATASGGGGGGSGGGAAIKWIASPAATYFYTLGTGGTNGAAGANTGFLGGPSGFGIIPGPTFITGTGGGGGGASTATTALTVTAGASNGGLGSLGDLNIGGGPGTPGYTLTATGVSGSGGSSMLGGGGASVVAGSGVANSGVNGMALGGGGSGGVQGNAGGTAAGGSGKRRGSFWS